jgi:protein gp37
MNKIGWCDVTWSPITGCSAISEGCDHCYAKRMSVRLAGRYGYPADEPFRVTLHPDRLEEPTRWRKSRRVFVCSMSDLFHERIADEALDRILKVTLRNRHHRYMILTKRPERMREHMVGHFYALHHEIMPWPHLWLGVTAENQERADQRIPILLDTPAAVRFVSVEPMLGPVDTSGWFAGYEVIDEATSSGKQLFRCRKCGDVTPAPCKYPYHPCTGIRWVICGGETGPGARPMDPDWARSLRDQCAAAGVPFFFKRMGGKFGDWVPEDLRVRQWPDRGGGGV